MIRDGQASRAKIRRSTLVALIEWFAQSERLNIARTHYHLREIGSETSPDGSGLIDRRHSSLCSCTDIVLRSCLAALTYKSKRRLAVNHTPIQVGRLRWSGLKARAVIVRCELSGKASPTNGDAGSFVQLPGRLLPFRRGCVCICEKH